MIECSVQNVTKYYGAEKLFENICFEIKTGERVGLIGANGSGKTTLLKCIMRSEEIQEGEISVRKGSKVGYLHQIPRYPDSTKAIEVIRLAFNELYQIKDRLNQLEKAMEKEIEIDREIKEYGKLTEIYEQKGGYEAEVQLDKVVNGLGIEYDLLEQPFELLSGGEKTRILLAKILLEEPDLLLLDEPSNHLDLKSVDWLENFLKEYKGSVLVVSHDRYFLDRVVGKIIEIGKKQADVYCGNYSYYVLEKERRFLVALKHYENQQRKIENMERQIERYRIWGSMRDSEKMFVRAKELEKRLEKIQKIEKPVFDQRRVDFQRLKKIGPVSEC